jgi:hypothetical protein
MTNETKVVETDKTKFTEDEMKSLQDLQSDYQEKQSLLGQLSVQRILLTQQVEAIESRQVELEGEYTATQQKERELVETLNEKYGPGELNPETGEFTPVDKS